MVWYSIVCFSYSAHLRRSLVDVVFCVCWLCLVFVWNNRLFFFLQNAAFCVLFVWILNLMSACCQDCVQSARVRLLDFHITVFLPFVPRPAWSCCSCPTVSLSVVRRVCCACRAPSLLTLINIHSCLSLKCFISRATLGLPSCSVLHPRVCANLHDSYKDKRWSLLQLQSNLSLLCNTRLFMISEAFITAKIKPQICSSSVH